MSDESSVAHHHSSFIAHRSSLRSLPLVDRFLRITARGCEDYGAPTVALTLGIRLTFAPLPHRIARSPRMLVPPARAPSAFLSLSGVAHEYEVDRERVPALAPVDLTVAAGEFVSIIGPSGCGKSTLLRIAAGLLTPSSGAVAADGAPPQELRRRKRIGFVSQDAALLPWRTAAGNVRLALEVNRQRSSRSSEVGALLDLVGLAGFEGYYPHQLSGGMRQRVALARALAPDPTLLVMDEPFGALDEITRAELRYELLRLRERLGAAVLFVTHSIAEAVLLSDRVAVMRGQPGRIVAVLPIELSHPRTQATEETVEFLEYTRRLRAALRGN